MKKIFTFLFLFLLVQSAYTQGGMMPAPVSAWISIPTPTVAFGLRQIVPTYSGACIRVLRISDNAEQDINCAGNSIDWTSAITFKGVSTIVLKTWYDQTGNSYSVTQPTVANMPTVDTVSQEIDFDGTNDFLQKTSVDLTGTNKISMFLVARTSSSSTQVFIEQGTTGAENNIIFFNPSTILQVSINGGSSVENIATFTNGSFQLIEGLVDRTEVAQDVMRAWRNASQTGITDGANNTQTGNFSNLNLNVGMRDGSSFPVIGSMKEFTLYSALLTTTQRQLVETNINTAYVIY
jgi:hypothetical protein